jgi:hypothetical protein
MKFIEYAALSNQLEKNNSNINEFVAQVTGTPLNEADEKKEDEIETGRAGKGFHSPKFVLKRKKLNNLAKQFLKEGKEKVVNKYAPKILGSTQKLASKAAVLSQEGKSPKEIRELLSNEAKRAIQIQEKSMKRLDTVIEKFSLNYDKRVQEIISKGELKEKSKNQLDMYWALLSLQVMQALDKALVKHREDMIEKAVGDNEELVKMMKLMSQSPDHQQELDKQAAEIKKAREAFKNAGEEEEEKPSTDSGEKTMEEYEELVTQEISDDNKKALISLAKDITKSDLTREEKEKLSRLISNAGIKKEDLK